MKKKLFIEIFYLLIKSYQLIPECEPQNYSLAQLTYPQYNSINTFVDGKYGNTKKINCSPLNVVQKLVPYQENKKPMSIKKEPPLLNLKPSTIYYLMQTPVITQTKYLTIYTTPVKSQIPVSSKSIPKLTEKNYNFLEKRPDKRPAISILTTKTSTISVPITKTSTVFVRLPIKNTSTRQLQFSPISTKKLPIKTKSVHPQEYIKFANLKSYASLSSYSPLKTLQVQTSLVQQTINTLNPIPLQSVSIKPAIVQQPKISQVPNIKTITITTSTVTLQKQYPVLNTTSINFNSINQSNVSCTTLCTSTNGNYKNEVIPIKTKYHNIFEYNLTARSNDGSDGKKFENVSSDTKIPVNEKSISLKLKKENKPTNKPDNANIKELKKVNKNIKNVYNLLKNQIDRPKVSYCKIKPKYIKKKKLKYLDYDEYSDQTSDSETTECLEDESPVYDEGKKQIKKLLQHTKNKKKIQYKIPEKSYLDISDEQEESDFKDFFEKTHHKIYYKDRKDNQYYEITSSEYENNEPIKYSEVVEEIEKHMSRYDTHKHRNYFTSMDYTNDDTKVLKMSDILQGNSYDPCFTLFKNKIDQIASGNFAYCSLLDSSNYENKGSLVYLSDII